MRGAGASSEPRPEAGPADAGRGAALRRVRLDRVMELFERMCALDDVRAPEGLAVARVIVRALERDREAFSDVFEASIATGGGEDRAFRFSYGLPGFRADPAAAARTALACAEPFGPAITGATKRLLRAALSPVVEQPLVGLAWDRGGAPRHKVYLQMRDAAGREAAELAGRLLATPWLAGALGDARLHMVGVDFGPEGVIGAKLYVAHAAMPADVAALVAPELRDLRDVLAIHRLGPATLADARLPPAADVDFGVDGGVDDRRWDDLARTPFVSSVLRGSRAFSVISAGFRIGVRRLSLRLAGPASITVYYALREVEEA